MDAARALALTRRWWWLTIIGAVVAVAAYGVAANVRDREPAPPRFAASALLLISLTDAYDESSRETFGPQLDRLLASYGELIAGESTAARASELLRIDNSTRDLRGRITADAVPDTQLLRVTMRGASPADAEALLAGTLMAFAQLHAERNLTGAFAVSETEPAVALPEDSEPLLLTVLLVAVAGVACAIGLALAFEYLSDTVRDAADAAETANVPLLPAIPYRSGAAPMLDIDGPRAERFRVLRGGIAARTDGAQVLLFTAPTRSCGTTEVAANIALSMAHAGRRVAFVDANMRFPSAGALFGIHGAGVAEAIAHDDLTIDEPRTATAGLTVIPAGEPSANPADLLDRARFDDLMRDLRGRFDTIVVDAPPVLMAADAALLALRADAAVLVMRADRTTRAEAAAAADTLGESGVMMAGAVVTGAAVPGFGWLGRFVRAPRVPEPEAGARTA